MTSLLLLVVLLWTAAIPVQDVPEPELDAAAIQARIKELEETTPLTDSQTAELTLLQTASKALSEAATHREEREKLKEEAAGAPTLIEGIQRALQVPLEEDPRATAPITAQDLDQLLLQEQALLRAAQQAHLDLERQLSERSTRLTELLQLIPEATQEARRLEEALATLSESTDPPVPPGRRESILAQKMAAEDLLARLVVENETYALRGDLMTARRDQALRDVELQQLLVDRTQEQVSKRRDDQAAESGREAAAARRAALNAHGLVKGVLEDNAVLAADSERLSRRLNELDGLKTSLRTDLAHWQGELAQMQSHEKQFGLNEFLGVRLRAHRSHLPRRRVQRSAMDDLSSELQTMQNAWLRLDQVSRTDPQQELAVLEKATPPPADPEARSEVEAAALEALTRRAELGQELLASYERTMIALTEVSQERQQLLALTNDFVKYIDERIFWTQTSRPLAFSDLSGAWKSVIPWFQPSSWTTLASDVWKAATARPVTFWLSWIAALLPLALRRRAGRGLERAAVRIRRAKTDGMEHTLTAVALTGILALIIPALVWTGGFWLTQPIETHAFTQGLGQGLIRLAWPTFLLFFLGATCRPGGLADLHFRWHHPGLAKLRSFAHWLLILAAPVSLMGSWMGAMEPVTNGQPMRRLLFILQLIITAALVARLLHPRSGALQQFLYRNPGSWVNRLRTLWFPAICLTPLAVATYSALGYTFAADQFHLQMEKTAAVILAALLLHSLLARWLGIAQRKLAWAQARAQAQSEESADSTLDDDSYQEIDITAAGKQVRKLLRIGVLTIVAATIFYVWIESLPALGFLRDIPLGGMTIVKMLDGVETPVPITLADLLVALLVLALTMVLSSNVPGLLEVSILSRLPLAPGGRYAAVTLLRYLIVVVGIVMGFNMIGIGWSQVQWLAAAVTVGLGFGMQEIFANFVSGLIILFERPIRVGDTVTIGQTTGTVSRIHMRATTILDWDRKELIIPNKEFVTGQVINWSLSDALVRAKIAVGVAYGSDTALVRRELLSAARASDRVLPQPAPTALFLGFGDSALDFELRVHVAEIDDYIKVVDELHERIDQAFRKVGIEIAFPQQDLHLRSVDATDLGRVRDTLQPGEREGVPE